MSDVDQIQWDYSIDTPPTSQLKKIGPKGHKVTIEIFINFHKMLTIKWAYRWYQILIKVSNIKE